MPGRPDQRVNIQFAAPSQSISQGLRARHVGGGDRDPGRALLGAIMGIAAVAVAASIVQHQSQQIATGAQVRQAYANQVGSPPVQLQVTQYASLPSHEVITRSPAQYMMIRTGGVVVVPEGANAVTEERLLVYPPGEDQPLESVKRVQIGGDGGQFENQFSIPLDPESPQGDYRYKLQIMVNKQVMGEQEGAFQAV